MKSLIKIGEAAKTLAARAVQEPPGLSWNDAAKNREMLAHHYSVTDRAVTWQTLFVSLPVWERALALLFSEAAVALGIDAPDTPESH